MTRPRYLVTLKPRNLLGTWRPRKILTWTPGDLKLKALKSRSLESAQPRKLEVLGRFSCQDCAEELDWPRIYCLHPSGSNTALQWLLLSPGKSAAFKPGCCDLPGSLLLLATTNTTVRLAQKCPRWNNQIPQHGATNQSLKFSIPPTLAARMVMST